MFLRQTLTTTQLMQITGWSRSKIHRKILRGDLKTLPHEEGEGVRGENYDILIEPLLRQYPQLRFPFPVQLPLFEDSSSRRS